MYCCRTPAPVLLHRLTALASVCCVFATSVPVFAAEAWKTGELFKRELLQPVGITWSNSELRPALEGLSNARRVALVLDRRADPNQKIELSFDDVPLGEAWRRIASRIGMATTVVGPVVYIGPENTAVRLKTVLALRKDDAVKLPSTARQRWTQLKELKWEPLSAPRDLLAALARESGIQIENLSEIPADLWAAGSLPLLALPERLTLLLAQFDLTYQTAPNGLSIHLMPLPEHPVIERTYPIPSTAQQTIESIKATSPLAAADISVQGKSLLVRGTQEQHELVAEALSGRTAKTTSVKEGRKVYTLNIPVEKPVSKLLNELAARLDWNLQIDRQAIAVAGLSLDTLVTVSVKDASEDELLHAILDPAGLAFRKRGNLIEVKPK
jgi:hypothetical protein